ncbi:hypothetical protein WJ971_31230 [Achromobacter xylosoxidans]
MAVQVELDDRLRLVDGRDLAVQIRIPRVALATEQALEGKPMHVELERRCRPVSVNKVSMCG